MAVFLILPTALLLFAMGFAGFLYARNLLVDQWRQTAVLRLERAAHYMDMRLARVAEWIDLFNEAAKSPEGKDAQEFILSRLKNLQGVTSVGLVAAPLSPESRTVRKLQRPVKGGPLTNLYSGTLSEITLPRYDANRGRETVSLISEIPDAETGKTKRLEVSVRFDYLMKDVENLGWWQSRQVCLVDSTGRYLAHSEAMEGRRRQLGETGDPVELAVLEQMQTNSHGTWLGSGRPPEMVAGFYWLGQAPWVLIMQAPGREILAPIIEFRFYYTVAGLMCIAVILLLINFAGGRMVRRIQGLLHAFQLVAKGSYMVRLPVSSTDEIGRLETGFNEMVEGLKELDFIRDTFGRYVDREVARELLQRPEASRLGGQKREVAILMSDLQGFTAVAESLSPEETIGILNHYFGRMIDVIHEHKGIIVDFYGDGVLVFFDPHEGPVAPAAERAVRCSLAMQRSMVRLNQEMESKPLSSALETRIAVHAGSVVVGNIGSASRSKYGIVGLAVNMTQRMETEIQGGQIVVSRRISELLGDALVVKPPFTARFKGIQDAVTLYLLEDFRPPE